MNHTGAKQRLGRWGENVAAEYLTARGYQVLARNMRTPYGEIDLLCKKDGVMVFVEVKTRSGTEYGMPEAAVTPNKRDHLLASIAAYWQQAQEAECDWRIDVIAILRQNAGKNVEVEHFENAIS
jgi:putative endonuclease